MSLALRPVREVIQKLDPAPKPEPLPLPEPAKRRRAELADGVNMSQEFNRVHHAPSVEEILDDLYASQINVSISLVTPGGGFYAELGSPMQAEVWGCESIWETVEWLSMETIRLYPDSQFAQRYGAWLLAEVARAHP